MPAKSASKKSTAVVAAPQSEVVPADVNLVQPPVAPEVKSDGEVKPKKPRVAREPPVDPTISDTRVRKGLALLMEPDASRAVEDLKLVKEKDKNDPTGKATVTLAKKLGDLSDATVSMILRHKPKSLAEKELKAQTPEQKAQAELRGSLFELLQQPRQSWADRNLSPEDAKVLRRMVKQDSIRTGDDAINTFTATANFVVRDLALAGLKNLGLEEKRVMKLHHVVEDISSLESWPLLKELQCVATARVEHVKRLQDAAQKLLDKKEKQKKKKAEKAAAAATQAENSAAPTDAKSTPSVSAPVSAASPTPPAPAAPAALPSKDKVPAPKKLKTPEADFEHHSLNIIRLICHTQGVTCEISGDVKHFCSLVVYELICMYSSLIQNQTRYAEVKTIKADTISSITKFILTYTRSSAPGLLKYVDDWLLHLVDEKKKAEEEKKKKAADVAATSATAAASDPVPVASA